MVVSKRCSETESITGDSFQGHVHYVLVLILSLDLNKIHILSSRFQ